MNAEAVATKPKCERPMCPNDNPEATHFVYRRGLKCYVCHDCSDTAIVCGFAVTKIP